MLSSRKSWNNKLSKLHRIHSLKQICSCLNSYCRNTSGKKVDNRAQMLHVCVPLCTNSHIFVEHLSWELLICTWTYFCTQVCRKDGATEIIYNHTNKLSYQTPFLVEGLKFCHTGILVNGRNDHTQKKVLGFMRPAWQHKNVYPNFLFPK